jgi:hypothetical protein
MHATIYGEAGTFAFEHMTGTGHRARRSKKSYLHKFLLVFQVDEFKTKYQPIALFRPIVLATYGQERGRVRSSDTTLFHQKNNA